MRLKLLISTFKQGISCLITLKKSLFPLSKKDFFLQKKSFSFLFMIVIILTKPVSLYSTWKMLDNVETKIAPGFLLNLQNNAIKTPTFLMDYIIYYYLYECFL
jgi:hypothetical protein